MKDLLTSNETFTNNGQVAFKSTLKPLNDMLAYSVRGSESFLNAFQAAYRQSPTEALRLLAYIRDCRGGKGEKDLFYSAMRWLKDSYAKDYTAMLKLAPFYGCFNDYRQLGEYTAFAELVKKDVSVELLKDVKNGLSSEQLLSKHSNQNKEQFISLQAPLMSTTNLAKWMPLCSQSSDGTLKTKTRKTKDREKKYTNPTKTSNKVIAELAMLEVLGLTHRQYRQLVGAFRSTKSPENQLSRKEYNIDFSKVPSRAMRLYNDAFKKHCEEQYLAFLEKVSVGEAKINSSHVLPYEIVAMADKKLNQVLWDSELKRIKDSKEAVNKILFCADVSDSMEKQITGSNATMMDVSVALSLMGAELLSGTDWKGLVCLFSEEGRFYDTSKYATINDKYRALKSNCSAYNTNVWSVFASLLTTAVSKNVSKEDMPEAIVIVSDMQFDPSPWQGATVLTIKRQFEAAGYSVPTLVFWNVSVDTDHVPVTVEDDHNVILLSGFSQSLFKKLLFTPIEELNSTSNLVLDILENERYNKINSLKD